MKSRYREKMLIVFAFALGFIIIFNMLNQLILLSAFRKGRIEYVNNIDEETINYQKYQDRFI